MWMSTLLSPAWRLNSKSCIKLPRFSYPGFTSDLDLPSFFGRGTASFRCPLRGNACLPHSVIVRIKESSLFFLSSSSSCFCLSTWLLTDFCGPRLMLLRLSNLSLASGYECWQYASKSFTLEYCTHGFEEYYQAQWRVCSICRRLLDHQWQANYHRS